jgi:hypothetical protein
MSLGRTRFVIQALYFVLIARSLGQSTIKLIGVVALVGIVYPFGTGAATRWPECVAGCQPRSVLGQGTATGGFELHTLRRSPALSHFALRVRFHFGWWCSWLGPTFGLSIIQLCGQAFQTFEGCSGLP